MFLKLHEFSAHQAQIGNKALALKVLADAGYSIPKFLVIPADGITSILDKEISSDQYVPFLTEYFGNTTLAIRSCALLEDTADSSMAGQFHTELDIPIEKFLHAARTVIEQAREQLMGDVSKFSLLIQEYIQPAITGVTFTRNPVGARELITEYLCTDKADSIVSGEHTPERIAAHYKEQFMIPQIIDSGSLFEQFRAIEKLMKAPQDIEWIVSRGTFYILQSRPITTLSKDDYDAFVYLDTEFSYYKPYRYEKTELYESVSRPTPFMQGLLDRLYAKDGPINRVYKSFQISYKPKPFQKIIGNELYVDTAIEIQTLLPAMRYKQNQLRLRFLTTTIFRTAWNIFRLASLRVRDNDIHEMQQVFVEKSNAVPAEDSLRKAIENFLHDYEFIFTINVLNTKITNVLQSALKTQGVSLYEILSIDFGVADEYQTIFDQLQSNQENLKGNSVDISDMSPFNISFNNKTKTSQDASDWFFAQRKFKQNYFKKLLIRKQHLDYQRELARVLTVKHINETRSQLKNSYPDEDLQSLLFLSIDDALAHNLDKTVLSDKKVAYEAYNRFTLPRVVSHEPESVSRNTQVGLSPGISEGKLVTVEMLDSVKENESYILYTPSLSPHLTVYFSKITGIISEYGGLLSHLAIMAREANIPIVSGAQLHTHVQIAKLYEIDGTTGSITEKNLS